MFHRVACRLAAVSVPVKAGAARSVTRTTACAAVAATNSLGAGSLRPLQAASYYAEPVPSWTVDHINALQHGSRGRNRPTVKLGNRLTPEEGRALNLAKRHGYLSMTKFCGVDVCNKYLHFCYEDQRPYIAINRHGDRVVVDLLPVEGVRGFHDPSRMDDVEDAFSELLQNYEKAPFMQIVNASTEEEVAQRVQAAAELNMDGSNEQKVDDTDITAQFHLLTARKQEAIMVARDMVKVVLDWDGTRKSAKQLALECAEKKLQTQYKWQKKMRRKLRELVADEKAFKRLPKGALDGFLKYEAEKKPHLKWYPAGWINKPC